MSARTATPGPRAGVGTATRDRIVDSALRLFSERGTSAVSMRELADAAGVTVQGLYYHFGSKAELIQAVYRARGVGDGLEPGLPDPSLAAELVGDRITEQARLEFARLVADEEFLRLMQRESVLGDNDARVVGHALERAWRDRWRAVLAGATDVAPGADLDAAADCIPTFLWGLFVEYLNHGDPAVVARIDAFAALIAPALTGGRA
jgi:AcrR family transcriptional regulator